MCEATTLAFRVCPQAFFFSTKTKKFTFPAQKKVPFLVLMCKVSGWLAHQNKMQFQTQFLPARRCCCSGASRSSSPLLLEWLYLGRNAKLTILPYHRNNDGKKGRVFFGRERCVLCFCARKKTPVDTLLVHPNKSIASHKTKHNHNTQQPKMSGRRPPSGGFAPLSPWSGEICPQIIPPLFPYECAQIVSRRSCARRRRFLCLGRQNGTH